ncbi:hypothetical protein JJC03_09380 [Flavobacterium oreochromis]|uniref:hypothetical protein n=1 Tax=Flavobacterium oreochromis TaxID=2906078 RepID=UPI001CE6447B|nr:hypothetical protein [Flavobacterium oreochromis]QYS85449.1 hypothetical protein JJC03_09380 [Flavobacterium oreochromis]
MQEEIYKIIRNNIPLRKNIADFLEVTETTVYGHAKRKAPTLNNYIVVKIIMKHTNKKESEIFEKSDLNFI